MKYNAFLIATHASALGTIPLAAAPGGFTFQHHYLDRQLPGDSWAQTALADLDKDGRLDYITGQTRGPIFWYRQEAPDRWVRHILGTNSPSDVGGAAPDVDGDLDVARSNLWFENADGKGLRWVTHENIPFGNPKQPYPLGTHCVALDLDRSGDTDLVMTENEIKAGRIGWLENRDGQGGAVAEHVILDANLGGHLVVAGDVDRDGDLDLVGKLWRPRKDNANEGRNHVDLLENRSR